MDRGRSTTGFSDLYGRLLEEFAGQTFEPGPSYGEANRSVREEIVRCLWFGSHFPPDKLTTDDGRRLEVVSPGWWNVEGGPDFIRAELLLEGSGRLVGNVEVHTFASDWFAHGHERQPEYDDVVLHVVMWDDAEDKQIRLHSGGVIPQLTLSRFVEEEVEELVEIVDLEGEPPDGQLRAVPGRYCTEAVASGRLDGEWLGRFLDCAGDYRLLSRSDRLLRLQERVPREQVLYESLAEALGYKNNRMPFLQLASLLPVKTLREIVPADAPTEARREALEAALFGVGGFLEEGADTEADEETRRYVERLNRIWLDLPAPLREGRMSPGHWTFAGTRPVNYPTRRIAALACLYAQYLQDGLFGHLVRVTVTARAEGRRRLDTSLRRALAGAFLGIQHPYWSRRCSFGGTGLGRPQALIGASRATSIIVDALLPLLLAHARSADDGELDGRLHLLWAGLPPKAPNTVLRRMCQVMFGRADGGRPVVNSTRRQQGLHQLYRDFCSSEAGCGRCLVYLAHRADKKLEEI